MERWVGRVALVTGASAGIGAAICKTLAEAGIKVVGAARRVENIEALGKSLKGAKGSVTGIKCDLTKEEDIYNMFKEIKTKYQGVDICINTAGISIAQKFLDSTPEEWHKMINVNIIALALCSKLAITSMRERGVDDGHIINFNSTAGHNVAATSSRFYASTKAAVIALTQGLRLEMRDLKSHIRITEISPGLVETEFAIHAYGGDVEKAKHIYRTNAVLQAEDLAASVLHVIASPPHVEINEMIIRPTGQVP